MDYCVRVASQVLNTDLVIAETRALLRAISGHVDQVGEILTRANRLLCADLPEGRFVTAFFGILDPAAHRLDYASAGHGPLCWYRAERREVAFTPATGLPLGLIEDMPIDPDPLFLFAPGDVGIFLSDGILEAEDPTGAAFGKERLARLVLDTAGHAAADMVGALAEAVRDFLHGGRQLDDLTAVVVKRR
jgi:phosphoserine phosphatase